jgi:hypothetical protein
MKGNFLSRAGGIRPREDPRALARVVRAGSERVVGAGEKQARITSFGTTRVSQRLRQDETVYNERTECGDSLAAGEKFG